MKSVINRIQELSPEIRGVRIHVGGDGVEVHVMVRFDLTVDQADQLVCSVDNFIRENDLFDGQAFDVYADNE